MHALNGDFAELCTGADVYACANNSVLAVIPVGDQLFYNSNP